MRRSMAVVAAVLLSLLSAVPATADSWLPGPQKFSVELDGSPTVLGGECHSFCTQRQKDFWMYDPVRVTYRCGVGSTDVDVVQHLSSSSNQNVHLRVCRSEQNVDCGQYQTLNIY